LQIGSQFDAGDTLQGVVAAARKKNRPTRQLGANFRELEKYKRAGWLVPSYTDPSEFNPRSQKWRLADWIVDYGFLNLPTE
jgi:hypothetical protein